MSPDPDIALVREAIKATPSGAAGSDALRAGFAALDRLEVRIAVLERELKQDRKVYYAPTPAENTDFEWKMQEC